MSPSSSFVPSSYPSSSFSISMPPSITPPVSNVPSEEPSMQPSIICDEIPVILRVDITTDGCPSETSWRVTNILTSQIVLEGNSYTNKYSLHSKTHPVCPQNCFLFTVYNYYGDGLNDWGDGNPGSYQVFFDNNLVHDGGGNEEFKEDYSLLFGVGCPSSEPSTSAEPSFAPSSAPTSAPSSAPTSAPSSYPTSTPSSTPSFSAVPSMSSNPSSAPSLPMCT